MRSWFSELERKAKPAPCSFSRSSDANGSHHLHRQLADKKNLHQNARIQKSTSRTAELIASSPNSRRRKKSLFSHSQTDIIPAVFPRPIHVGCLRDPVPGTPKSNKRPWLIGRPTSSVFSGTRMKLFFCACNLKCLAFALQNRGAMCTKKSSIFASKKTTAIFSYRLSSQLSKTAKLNNQQTNQNGSRISCIQGQAR